MAVIFRARKPSALKKTTNSKAVQKIDNLQDTFHSVSVCQPDRIISFTLMILFSMSIGMQIDRCSVLASILYKLQTRRSPDELKIKSYHSFKFYPTRIEYSTIRPKTFVQQICLNHSVRLVTECLFICLRFGHRLFSGKLIFRRKKRKSDPFVYIFCCRRKSKKVRISFKRRRLSLVSPMLMNFSNILNKFGSIQIFDHPQHVPFVFNSQLHKVPEIVE